MKVYHGSNSNFRQLKISSRLVRYDSTKSNEGLGIYFSTDINVASSYGKYLYTLYINDKYFKDFRKKAECSKHIDGLIRYVYSKTKIDIRQFIDMNSIRDRMYFGGLQIFNLNWEVALMLDSTEKWYTGLSQTARNKVLVSLRQYDKEKCIAYMFNYNINNIGVIKKISDDIVVIGDKQII